MTASIALPKLIPQSKGHQDSSSTTETPVRTAGHRNVYPCIYCREHFPVPDHRAEHIATMHGISLGWLCLDCPETFSNGSELRQHQRAKHYDPYSKLQYCYQAGCEYKTSSTGRLARHRSDDHGSGFLCRECGFENDSCVGISTHKLHWHSAVQKCEKCFKKFASPAEQLAHATESVKCEACEDSICSAYLRGCHMKFACAAAVKKRSEEDAKRLAAKSGLKPAKPPAPTVEDAPPSPITPHRSTSSLRVTPASRAANDDNCSITGISAPGIDGRMITIPQSANLAGFTPGDFDPLRHYDSTKPSRNGIDYRDIPADVPAALVFNADPKLLCRGNLLRLAEQYSTNSELLSGINEGRPKKVLNSSAAVFERLKSALEWQAKELGISVADAKARLTEKRKAITPASGSAPSRKRKAEKEDVAVDVTAGGAQPTTPPPEAKRPRVTTETPEEDHANSIAFYVRQQAYHDAMPPEQQLRALGKAPRVRSANKPKTPAMPTPRSTPTPAVPGKPWLTRPRRDKPPVTPTPTPTPVAKTVDLTGEDEGDKD